ncbi:MAG: hypothetical protein OCU22_03720 [Canidatus Methanoxibalbensis ujae]|nr:hypothetical protein [Candidatus Methanoxibalbensis ujae]
MIEMIKRQITLDILLFTMRNIYKDIQETEYLLSNTSDRSFRRVLQERLQRLFAEYRNVNDVFEMMMRLHITRIIVIDEAHDRIDISE